MRNQPQVSQALDPKSNILLKPQGCPLSPLIFALCSDVLLRELAQILSEDDAVCAFADDTGLVVSDYAKSLPALCSLFSEFERISGLIRVLLPMSGG